ncbi:hypothetical protein E3N88_19714 [Mikania micrantha]|uniref:Uncharacterized protein n=1 Tax=Mikania micrantha TaxID=192012 RepID=A0A5N6NRS1_9ASTR|nr:hypothetical protein E3N88_19714 [Mikania micrantha]
MFACQKRVIECDFRPEKEEKDLIYVGKLVDCNWGPFEALDFVNLVSSLLFQSAGFSFSFAISFDAFEAEKVNVYDKPLCDMKLVYAISKCFHLTDL